MRVWKDVAGGASWLRGGAAAVLALTLTACGSDTPTGIDPTPPPAPSKAVIKVLIDPNPVTAVPTGDSTYPWDFRVNLQLSDSGGVGFIVTSMLTTVSSALSGGTLDSSDENAFVGIKIAAFGQETRQFHMGPYRMENHTKEGKINFKINFVDDKGNASVYDGTVDVQNLGAPVELPQ